MRTPLILLGAVCAAALLGYVLYSVLSNELPAVEVPEPPTPEPQLTSTDLSPEERPTHSMRAPYPFNDFAGDIAEARTKAAEVDRLEDHKRFLAYGTALADHKVTVRLEDATIEQLMGELRPEFDRLEIPLTMYDDDIPQDRFDVFMTDRGLYEVLMFVQKATNGNVTVAVNADGACVGSRNDIYQYNIESEKRTRERVAKRAQKSELLDVKFRPSFQDADVPGLLRLITSQTEIEVIADPSVWSRTRTLSWSANEMKLRKALDRICSELDATYFEKDGRVFIVSLH